MDRHAAARSPAHLLAQRIEQRDNAKPLAAEARIIGQRKSQVPGAHDRHRQLPVESQNGVEPLAQVPDDVADAAHAKVAEVRQVFADQRRVQAELLGEVLRGHGLDALRVEFCQETQIEG